MSDSALNISRHGMECAEALIKTLSNNIANMNSKGFKSDVARFVDLGYQTIVHPGAEAAASSSEVIPVGIQFGSGAKLSSVSKDFTQGEMIHTENKLNIAIDGKGFFSVDMPDGTVRYTRDGDIHIDPNTLQFVTSQGYVVSPGIELPESYTDVVIKDDGTVWVALPGEAEMQEIGRFETVSFINTSGLKSCGNGMFEETAASGAPIVGNPTEDGFGKIMQYYLEGSNANPMVQMVDLINAQRSFELNLKAMEAESNLRKNLNTSHAA